MPFSSRYEHSEEQQQRHVVAAEDEGEFDHEEEGPPPGAHRDVRDDDDDAQSYRSTTSKPAKPVNQNKSVRFQFQRNSSYFILSQWGHHFFYILF